MASELKLDEKPLPRVIIYSGKGGTGKTTVSAATAVTLARSGKKVLIMSSDPAHSLSDVFNVKLSRTEPTLIETNLSGLEIDTIYELKRNMSGFQKYVADSYKEKGVDSSVAGELTTQPGLDEIFSLNRLLDEATSGKWDVVLLDTSPTGNTLRLLAYPELIIGGNTGKSLFKAYKGMAGMMRPMGGNVPDAEFFDEVNILMKQMEDLNRFILRGEVSIRLVLNPEKLSILETKRAYTFLHIYGINIDAIVINKILPNVGEVGQYFEYWTDLHKKYLMEIDNSFYPTPVFRAELQRTEPIGVDALHEISKMVFKDKEADKVFYSGKNFWIAEKKEQQESGETLCIRVPFLKDAEVVEVKRYGTDISVTIDRVQRLITLPRLLYNLEMDGFIREPDVLKVRFKEQVEKKEATPIASKSVLDKLRLSRKQSA